MWSCGIWQWTAVGWCSSIAWEAAIEIEAAVEIYMNMFWCVAFSHKFGMNSWSLNQWMWINCQIAWTFCDYNEIYIASSYRTNSFNGMMSLNWRTSRGHSSHSRVVSICEQAIMANELFLIPDRFGCQLYMHIKYNWHPYLYMDKSNNIFLEPVDIAKP